MEYQKELQACVLCHNAPCTEFCPEMEPERLFRAAKLSNLEAYLADRPRIACGSCMGGCSHACPKGVAVDELVWNLYHQKAQYEERSANQVDLSCEICGVKLENPFLLSSSVVSSSYDMCARAFEMGWAGAAFKTLSLMDIHEASPRFDVFRGADGSFAGFKNIEQLSDHSLEENMECFRQLKANYPTKVIVASIMGRNESEWEYLARKVTEAGADVIELNFSCPNMEERNTGVTIGQDPTLVERFTAAARRGTDLPILAKMTPNITDMCVPAEAAVRGGANGIAAINTIMSITGVNLNTLAAKLTVQGQSAMGGYSGRAVKPIALRFITDLAQDPALKGIHISGMGGIYTWADAAEFLLLGAGSIQITTAVMEYGYRIIEDLLLGLRYYLAQRNYGSVTELIGSASDSIVPADKLQRDSILLPRFHRNQCIGCGRCYLSCRDGGHQAIRFDAVTRRPILRPQACVGCHLCLHVCPQGAIGTARRRIHLIK